MKGVLLIPNLKISYLEEPELIFGGHKEDKDPRIGLKVHGPFSFSDEPNPFPSVVNVGIVGTGEMITKTEQFLEELGQEVKSKRKQPWLYQDYPGFNIHTKFHSRFYTSKSWERPITASEEKYVLRETNVNKRILKGVQLYADKVRLITIPDPKPSVIICGMSDLFYNSCGISHATAGRNRPNLTEREKQILKLRNDPKQRTFDVFPELKSSLEGIPDQSFDLVTDFHDALKGKIMQYKVPVQLLREASIEKFHLAEVSTDTEVRGEDPSNIAWNLSTALYYKASGKPWRLAKLREDSCFIGISFYRNKILNDNEIMSSMAQVFTESGEGLVIKGEDVEIDRRTKEAHMSESQSEDLLRKAVSLYTERKNHEPARVVIHKTSSFSEREKKGLNKVIGNKLRDFVAITDEKQIKLLRQRRYPVLRGTVLYIGARDALLYTTGFVPRLRTYDGPMIPTPIHITHEGDSTLKEICEEIMGLSKLDWNTTEFSVEKPITLQFSKNVGWVLAQLPASDPFLLNEYRYYM